MNGQYLMNKEISVQYAYKKDGKGERHGDQAERMLATQARKHNVQPQVAPIPAPMFGAMPPVAGAPAMNGSQNPVPAGFGTPNGIYQSLPPPQQSRPPPTPSTPLAAPPSGLPARPPPSQAGYGGPQSFMPPGFGNMPQSFSQPPAAFAPPVGFAPPGGMHGVPPPMPPGFQPNYRR